MGWICVYENIFVLYLSSYFLLYKLLAQVIKMCYVIYYIYHACTNSIQINTISLWLQICPAVCWQRAALHHSDNNMIPDCCHASMFPCLWQGSCFIELLQLFLSCFSQIEDALTMKDKKYNILVILSSCNVLSVTLLCSLLWYVYDFLTTHSNFCTPKVD